MTVLTTQSSQIFPGNGVANIFPCNFRIFDDTDVEVSLVNQSSGTSTPLVLNSDYTIAWSGNASGFTLSTTNPVATGINLYVQRAIAYEQPTDFTNQGSFFPTMHEDMADRLAMQIQQLVDASGRAVTIPGGLDPAPSSLLPLPQGGSLLGWAADGSQLVNTGASGVGAGSIADVNVAAGAAIQGSKLGFLQAGTGAVGRTVQDKLRDVVHVNDFDAVADYTPSTNTGTDNTAAFARAYAYIVSLGGGTIRLGRGNYMGRFTITDPFVHIVGEGEWGTTLWNVDNNPVISISNASKNVTDVLCEGFSIQNRAPGTWTGADGVVISGTVVSNSCDFLSFKDMYILNMRYGFNLTGRTIWNWYERVHVSTSLIHAFSCNATDNCGAQMFVQCRFALSGQHGIFMSTSFTTFPTINWTFYNCTFENNTYNGVRLTGTGAGPQAWVFNGCYMENNATGISVGGSGGLQKANIFIDTANLFGIEFASCSFFGTDALPNMDYGIYVNSGGMTTVIGEVHDCRFGTNTQKDIFWPGGVTLGQNVYSSGPSINRSLHSVDLRDLGTPATAFTPVLQFGGASTGITYSNQVGRYIQIGNIVFFEIYISLSSVGTATGVATLTGLPLPTAPSPSTLIPAYAVVADQFQSGVANVMARSLTPGGTSIELDKFASGTLTQMANTDFGNFSRLSITGHYFTA